MGLTKIDDRGLKTPIDLLDNEKIRLGTGNDLELYHAGTNSLIVNKTNNLYINSAGEIYLAPNNNEAGVYVRANGAVELYYDNSKKFETTSSGATVTGSLGIGTSPSFKLHLQDSSAVIIQGESTGNNTSSILQLKGKNSSGTVRTAKLAYDNADQVRLITPDAIPLCFYTQNGERMRIDSSGKVGIGETSMDALLVIKGASDASTTPSIRLKDGSDTREAWISNTSGDLVLANGGDDNTPHCKLTMFDGNIMQFSTANTERMRIDSSGRVGINDTSPDADLSISNSNSSQNAAFIDIGKAGGQRFKLGYEGNNCFLGATSSTGMFIFKNNVTSTDNPQASGTEHMRLTGAGELLIGTTSGDIETLTSSGSGARFNPNGRGIQVASNAIAAASFNRTNDDGTVVQIRGQGNVEGTISVSGSSVSYNGGHLSRWSQFKGLSQTDKSARPTIYQGTVMSNLDDLCVWEGEDNQQLNMTKVSDVVGDKDVAGVFFTWDDDDDKVVNDFYVAMTGDMVIRVADSTTVARGDLLISAGDGTAKPQADDIVRSSTIAKITSTNHTATYADGSKAYPCVLMAC